MHCEAAAILAEWHTQKSKNVRACYETILTLHYHNQYLTMSNTATINFINCM